MTIDNRGINPIPRGVLHAYTSIARQEGVVGGLWRGTGANVTRNAIVNVGETVVYDAAKDALLTAGYMRWVGQKQHCWALMSDEC